MEGEMMMMMMWGTWEELVLAGAVLRHGIQDWDAVALELRARTLYPYNFTPEACKAKYEDLQQHHSGCIDLFEELRKQRMAELKRSLEQSDDSIGSLQSKLETLKAEKGDECHVDYGSSQTESPAPFQKSEGVESSGKESSKDGLSAGSFTQQTQTNWSPECQIPAVVLSGEMENKPEISGSSEKEKVSCMENLAETFCIGQGGSLRKRRGKRKRKDCNRDVKEGSVGESDFWGSVDVVNASLCRETSTSDCGPTVRSSSVNDCNQGSSGQGIDDLMGIFDSVVENEVASIFRRRLDSQKRARYKKLVRQHMDFDTIRSRIASSSITTARELFRDLLLLVNNVLVFYSKKSREHKSALLLRNLATDMIQQHYKVSSNNAAIAILPTPPTPNPPAKPRSVHPGNCNLSGKVVNNAGNVVTGTSQGGKKLSNADYHPAVEPSPLTKKGSSWQGKAGRRTASRQPEAPTKGRKRARGR